MTTRVDAAGAAAVLARHREATVLCHVRPDADALGSATGLARVLRGAGLTVHLSFDPGEVPDGLRAIPGTDEVLAFADVPAHGGLVVVLDCASSDRAGDWGRLAEAAAEVLVVDHHGSNPGFGTHLLLDPAAASTATLVTEVLDAGGYAIDPVTATCLYAGLVTDTGSFRWGGPGAHDTARRLLDAGAETDELGFELLDAHPFSWLRVLGGLLDSVRLEPGAAGGRGVVWLEVPYAITSTVSPEDVESLVSSLRGVREAAVSVLLKEYREGEWAVSLRSRGGVDVASVASALGGGGHPAAAGCTVHGGVDSVVARLRDLLG